MFIYGCRYLSWSSHHSGRVNALCNQREWIELVSPSNSCRSKALHWNHVSKSGWCYRKSQGSTKSLGFILCGLWMSVQNIVEIHPIWTIGITSGENKFPFCLFQKQVSDQMGFTLSEITVYRCINLMFKSHPSLDTNDHFSYQSNMLSLLTSWINFALTYTCSLQFNKYQKQTNKKKNRREVLQTNISFLIVRSIVPWNQYHYITPDGSLAPLFICNMFIRPAGKHTRAHCLWSFSYPQLSHWISSRSDETIKHYWCNLLQQTVL